ncbi:MAG: hypothetical protein G01um101472_565 [Parcubacteria group bacterium Gr01-1014_72]|nr:MAG: hypothetical protein G01um101472_565 [Parcubacteria group bacterium Gr01-1014_72]
MKPNLSASKKHFQQDGHWIVRPVKTVILICECGNKYIKTRLNQTVCVGCLVRPKL